jgi:hypothetical protein
MQCRLVVCYRSFGTKYRSHFKGQAVQEESRNVEFTVRTAIFVVTGSCFAIRIVHFEVGTAHSPVSTLSFLPGRGLFVIETTILSLRILYVSVGTARSPVYMYVCFFLGKVLFAVSNVHIALWYCILYCRCHAL